MKIKVKIPGNCFSIEDQKMYNGTEVLVDICSIVLPNGSIWGVYPNSLGIELVQDSQSRVTDKQPSLRDLIGQDIARLELK